MRGAVSIWLTDTGYHDIPRDVLKDTRWRKGFEPDKRSKNILLKQWLKSLPDNGGSNHAEQFKN